MNVSFVGCPCSGKTTTAAMVFAYLKEAGLPVEFVPEYARQYIAQRRLEQGLSPQDQLKLTDQDQIAIMAKQADMEWTMSKVCGPNVVVVSDSSPLNALLYMRPEARKHSVVRLVLETRVLPVTDLVCYASPIGGQSILDPNRVHDQQQSLLIDAIIPAVLAAHAPNVDPLTINGRPEIRAAQVRSQIFQRLGRL
jgi:hypothetical protein